LGEFATFSKHVGQFDSGICSLILQIIGRSYSRAIPQERLSIYKTKKTQKVKN